MTSAPEVHICIVSDQLLANIIPALMRRPQHVHLLTSERMHEQAERLKRFLEARGIPATLHPDMPDHDVAKIAAWMSGQLEAIVLDTNPALLLNATGGTKLMTLALFRVLEKNLGRLGEVIYTDTANYCLERLQADGDEAPEPMREVLHVPDLLEAGGMTYRSASSDDADWRAAADERKSLSKLLGKGQPALGQLIGQLNRSASEAIEKRGREERLAHPGQHLKLAARGERAKAEREVLELAESCGLIDRDEADAGRIWFRSVDAARYLGGLWLEEYVWHIARDAGFADVRAGVEITWQGTAKRDAQRNEFDLLIAHRNRLLTIECKTANFNGRAGAEAQHITSKLDSLGKHAGGAFSSELLISARELTRELHSRCQSLRIKVIQTGQLANLRSTFQNWDDADSS